MKNQELFKPCPFCGNEKQENFCEAYDDHEGMCYIWCDVCDCHSPKGLTQKIVKSKWNKRAK